LLIILHAGKEGWRRRSSLCDGEEWCHTFNVFLLYGEQALALHVLKACECLFAYLEVSASKNSVFFRGEQRQQEAHGRYLGECPFFPFPCALVFEDYIALGFMNSFMISKTAKMRRSIYHLFRSVMFMSHSSSSGTVRSRGISVSTS